MIRNPVPPGFNPDPSFLRVGQDHYLATSTFEWFPGVSIYHSRAPVEVRTFRDGLPLAFLWLRTPDTVPLVVTVDHAAQRFWWRRVDGWQPLGPVLDASMISDEDGQGEHGAAPGAVVCMAAMDLTGQALRATFGRFTHDPTVFEELGAA